MNTTRGLGQEIIFLPLNINMLQWVFVIPMTRTPNGRGADNELQSQVVVRPVDKTMREEREAKQK